MRKLSRKDLEDLAEKNVRLVTKDGKRVRPKKSKSEIALNNLLSDSKTNSSAVTTAINALRNTIIKLANAIIESMTATNNQYSKISDILTSPIPKKTWSFEVKRNKNGTIKEIIAREV